MGTLCADSGDPFQSGLCEVTKLECLSSVINSRYCCTYLEEVGLVLTVEFVPGLLVVIVFG